MLQAVDLKEKLRRVLESPGAASSDFDLNEDLSAPQVKLRDAAVLITFLPSKGSTDIVLTKRSPAMKHHPGQIACPGGKFDAGDGNLRNTALRETCEEIGVHPASVDILGALPAHQTVTGFQVTPFVGWLEKPQSFVAETGEVSEVFTVPAAHVLNPRNFRVEGRLWQGKLRKFYVVPFGPYYIWGATARMLKALAERMDQ